MKATKENGFYGYGWYTIRFWDNEVNEWETPEAPEPIWIETAEDFEAETEASCEEFEAIIDYLGDEEAPNE